MLSKWFGGESGGKSRGREGNQGNARRKADDRSLRLEALEDRSLLSVSVGLPSSVAKPLARAPALVATTPVAAQLSVKLPPSVPNAMPVLVTVMALDAQNRFVPNFSGTLKLTSSDSGATLPATVACKFGVATLQAKFVTGGTQTITATDSANSSIKGTGTTNVAAPVVATRIAVGLPPSAPNGKAIPVTLVAVDAQNRPVPNYTGTANVTCSDTGATIPATVTFKQGKATFQATFVTAGSQTITVTDSSNAALKGSATTNVAAPAVATRIAIAMPPSVPNSKPVPVALVAVDAQNRPVSTYNGTVNLTCTDTGATLPATVTFKDGKAAVQVTFVTAGVQKITATDSVNAALTGTATTNVAAPQVARRFSVLIPPYVPNGKPITVFLVALDNRNLPVLNYSGTVTLTSSDTGATLPASVVFKDGRATIQVTFATAGRQTLTVTDTSSPTVTGSASTTVAAAVKK